MAQLNIKKIILTELAKGRSPEKILEMAQKAKIDQAVVLRELKKIENSNAKKTAKNNNSQNRNEKVIREKINKVSALSSLPLIGNLFSIGGIRFDAMMPKERSPDTKPLEVWTPTGKKIYAEDFEKGHNKLEKVFKKYTQKPGLPRRNLFLFLLPVIFATIYFGIFPESAQNILSSSENIQDVLVIFAPAMIYWWRVRSIQRDLIKSLIAKKNNWIYNPEKNPIHWAQFKGKFPEIFKKGTDGQNMQDEFWGKFKGKKQAVDFYSGLFQYTVTTGSGKNRSSKTYTKTIFSIKLNKKLKSNFRLEPESFGSKILNFFSRKEIETESSEFNKTFAFYYNGKKSQKALEIIKTLSPAVQLKLLNLKETEGNFTILFKEQLVLFVFKGKLLKKMKTNFFKKVELDPRDQKTIENRINNILDISTDMMQYLD